jgi:peptidoglycan hydrolase-like protein with peptidoglycan-binding domain
MNFRTLASSSAFAALLLGAPALAQQSNQQQEQTQAQSGQQQTGQQGQQTQTQSAQQDGQGQSQTQKEGAQIHIAASSVAEVQKSLNQKGFDVGEVNGQLSGETEEALKNFQTEQKLTPTGKLTVETLSALGLDPMGQSGGEGGGGMSDGEPAPLMVGPDVVRQVQQQLNQKGFDVGEVDGQWSSETQKAAESFAKEQGMPATGNLNIALVEALGVDLRGGGQGGQQGGSASGSGEQQAEATPLYVAPETVTKVKEALNQKGYDAGSLDAEWSGEAKTALKNFQESEGMPPSDMLTTSALNALGIEWTSASMGSASGGGSGGGSGDSSGEVEVEIIGEEGEVVSE